MPRPARFLCLFVSLLLAVSAAAAPQVFMIGDSTMANKPLDLPERGWGMAFGDLVRAPAIVKNHAMNGRSTKSFIDEGRWGKVLAELRAGDFVIIQFSHNDEKKEDPKRYTDPATTFPANLRRFIAETRAKQATPILATPVARRKFGADGKITPTHGSYPAALRQVAAEEKVTLLELEKSTERWLQAAGPEASKKFFMWIEPGTYPKIPDGRKDDTHFVGAGAEAVAAMAAAELRRGKSPLAAWLR